MVIMNEFNHKQDHVFVPLLKACAKKKDLHEGVRLHADILERGLLERSSYIASSLVSLYAKCGALDKAKKVLKELPDHNRGIVAWNALIGGYAQEGNGHDALSCFEQMQCEGICPDNVTFICILKACGKIGAIDKGTYIHDKIVTGGSLGKDVMLGNALVDMYTKCCSLHKARKVLEELPIRDVVSWNALIAGYSSGEAHEALKCYEQMQREGVCPDAITFICILKACGKMSSISRGEQVHDEIIKRGLIEKDIMVGATLVDMYVKCGMISKAHNVLEQLPVRNAVCWSALIAGYVEQGRGHEAFSHFEQMRIEGLSPDAVTFICILKACGSIRDVDKGEEIHKSIVDMGLSETDVALGTALVDMYAKCGVLAKARRLLDAFPVRNAASWSAVIAGYAQEGEAHEALNCFEQMQSEGVCADAVTFICILTACGSSGFMEQGRKIHDEIVRMGFLGKDAQIGNALVGMYAKCGALSKAREVIEQLPVRNTVSWNALIAGYANQGQDHEALDCFGRMQRENLSPDAVTFICLLKACGKSGYIEKGIQIHEEVVNAGWLQKDVVLGTALVDMYLKCGALAEAAQVLEELPFRDQIAWNALIAGCAQQGKSEEALRYFELMRGEGLRPDAVTFICILQACAIAGSLKEGIQAHEMIIGTGLLEKGGILGNALVDMYAKCGALANAWEALKQQPVQNVVAWNALISGYVEQRRSSEALDCFDRMQSEGIAVDEITLLSTLKACSDAGAIEKGKHIHDEIIIIGRGLLKEDMVLGAALMDMYAKHGMLARAREVLEELRVRDVVVWNVLIAGYAREGQCHEALNCLSRLSFAPDEATFIGILSACGKTGAIDKGKQIHAEIVRRGWLETSLVLGNGLVDMYAKCGMLSKAHQTLDELPSRDVVSWNSLIAGYAQYGHSHEVLNCFEWMQCEGLDPDEVTCVCVLAACCRSGLVDEAEAILGEMADKYGIAPSLELCTYMVAILGCIGRFDKALVMIEALRYAGYATVWVALLGACSKWGNVKLAKLAFVRAVQIDKSCAAAYVIMANIFAALGMQEEARNVEAMRLKFCSEEAERTKF